MSQFYKFLQHNHQWWRSKVVPGGENTVVPSSLLPECVPLWPRAPSESQTRYGATPVNWQRWSFPAVWTCTCWWWETQVFGQWHNLLAIVFPSPKSLLWCAEMKITGNVYPSGKEDSPHAGSDWVFLSPPCRRVVDGLAVDLQPLTHLPQTLLEDGSDPSIGRRTDVHQQVSATRHSLHQRLTHRHNTHENYSRSKKHIVSSDKWWVQKFFIHGEKTKTTQKFEMNS